MPKNIVVTTLLGDAIWGRVYQIAYKIDTGSFPNILCYISFKEN